MTLVKDEKKYIVQSAKDLGDFVQVKFKGADSILIPLEDYFMMAIKLNSVLSKDIYDKYTVYQDVYEAYIRIKYRISLKDYTMFEIKKYCMNKLKLSNLLTDAVMEMVSKSNLVDDHAYALNKAGYFHDSGLSRNEIRDRLKKVGIKESWIDEAIFGLSDDKESENAYKFAQKAIKTIKGKSVSLIRSSLIQKMTMKGFSYNLSKQIVEEMDIKEDDSALELTYNKAKRLYVKLESSKRKEKIRMYCMRKGFSLSQINELMEGEEYD